ncbi:MAG: hypothetical protein MUE85_05200 [Microscillaceae bacterium]|jgi:hypothetical protein|nr:hypothetical protein [Microscillaceae bacterium]
MIAYPWYEQLANTNKTLQQGDLIPNCPIVMPPQNLQVNNEYEIEVKTYDVAIMSQSCDLENGKVEIVLACPFFTFTDYVSKLPTNQQTSKEVKRQFDKLRQGHQPNYHLLNKDDSVGIKNYLVVDFRNVYGVNIQFLQEYIQSLENRVRLLPPYREHLAQAFARFFMRVGLPQNIPPLS